MGLSLVFGQLLTAGQYDLIEKLFSAVVVFVWNFVSYRGAEKAQIGTTRSLGSHTMLQAHFTILLGLSGTTEYIGRMK